MKLVVVSVEGVLAKEEVTGNFAEFSSIPDGLALHGVLDAGSWVVLATGSYDSTGIRHWLRSNGIKSDNLYAPVLTNEPDRPMWRRRMSVLIKLSAQYRGNMLVVETNPVVCETLTRAGATILQPWWARRQAEIDGNEYVPLRPHPQFWNS